MRQKFSKLEVFIILVGLAAVTFATYLVVTNRSLFSLIGYKTETLRAIGHVDSILGKVIRKTDASIAFEDIEPQHTLYLNDTIMTGPSSQAKIVLSFDKQEKTAHIVPPNTLVRLILADGSNGQELIRVETIEAPVAPAVSISQRTVEKKTVVAPLEAKLLCPTDVSFTPTQYHNRQHITAIQILSNRRDIPLHMEIRAPTRDTSASAIATNELVERYDNITAQSAVPRTLGLSHAGIYEITLYDFDNRVVDTCKIAVQAKILGYFTLDASESRRKLNNQLRQQAVDNKIPDFRLQFRPKILPTSTHEQQVYKLEIRGTKSPNILRSIETKEFSVPLEGSDFFRQPLEFRVSAQLQNGFTAESPFESFGFTYLPPTPKSPDHQSTISFERLRQQGFLVQLTWSKVNFAQKYHIHVSTNAQFSDHLVRADILENFYIFRIPTQFQKRDIQFYWQIDALFEEGHSAKSSTYTFGIN